MRTNPASAHRSSRVAIGVRSRWEPVAVKILFPLMPILLATFIVVLGPAGAVGVQLEDRAEPGRVGLLVHLEDLHVLDERAQVTVAGVAAALALAAPPLPVELVRGQEAHDRAAQRVPPHHRKCARGDAAPRAQRHA